MVGHYYIGYNMYIFLCQNIEPVVNNIIAFSGIYQRQPVITRKCAIIHAVYIGVVVLNGHVIKIKFGCIKCKLLFNQRGFTFTVLGGKGMCVKTPLGRNSRFSALWFHSCGFKRQWELCKNPAGKGAAFPVC
jgi:hypothetical protein